MVIWKIIYTGQWILLYISYAKYVINIKLVHVILIFIMFTLCIIFEEIGDVPLYFTGGYSMCCQRTLIRSFTETSWQSSPKRLRLPTAITPTTALDSTPRPPYECWRTWTEGRYPPAEGVKVMSEQKTRQCYALPTFFLLTWEGTRPYFGYNILSLVLVPMWVLLRVGWGFLLSSLMNVAWNQVFINVHGHITLVLLAFLSHF